MSGRAHRPRFGSTYIINMKVVVAGATGFVGEEVVNRLSSEGHEIVGIVHSESGSNALTKTHSEIKQVRADVSDDASVRAGESAFAGAEALIYLPGLLREFPAKGITFRKIHVDGVRVLIEAAKRLGIRRWIQMSALGARADAPTGYFLTKWEGEQLVRASGLDWTILRPSVIFSTAPTKKMNFVGELANVIRNAPFIPVFGDGNYRMQPVSIEDVADACVKALGLPATVGQSYDIGGPEKIAYEQIMRMIGAAMGKHKPVFHLPFYLINFIAMLFDRFEFFPVSRDQLTMLKEENIVSDPSREHEFI
jgi:uncharacterized protein YbjT (DUF2867 family)